jgi:hypothetical protein
MIAYVGTFRAFDRYCHEQFGMTARVAVQQRKAFLATSEPGVRGLRGPLTIVDSGEDLPAPLLRRAYEQIDTVNALAGGTP